MAKSADAFRTISEVADWLGIPAHVLRFWESKFTQVKPVKRAGGRRYYRPADMQLLGGIRKLLHDEGMTIKGVQKVMREQGVRHVAAMSPPLDADLDGANADIALNVPEAEDEPRGQVVSFDRSSAPEGAEKDAGLAEKDAASTEAPEPADVPEDTEASGAAEDLAENVEPSPDKAEPAAAEAQETAETEATPDEAATEAPSDKAPDDSDAPESVTPEATTAKAETAETPESSAPAAPPAPEVASNATAPLPDAGPASNDTASAPEDAPRSDPAAPEPSKEDAAQAQTDTVAPVDTPDDPPDSIPAPPSVIRTLARIRRADAETAAGCADIAARLADLRQRMGDGRKSS